MPLVLKDRVKETTTTTGTGTITLAGAVSGYQSFSVIGDANTTYYTIVDASTGSWEVGIGTYTLSGTTLSRDTVLESSNSGSLVNFGAGTKDVFVTYPAERAVVSGDTAYLSLPAPSTNGNVLTSNGTEWTSATPASTSTLTITNLTGVYTVLTTDGGKVFNCTSGTFTVSLTAAATLGSGFNCWIWNTGTGAITIDPNLSETIDGVTTLTLQQGEGTQIVCTGTNWQTGDKKTMRGYAENISSTATRPIATGNSAVAIGAGSASLGAVATGAGAVALGSSRSLGVDSFAAAIANNTTSYGTTASNSVAIGRLARTGNSDATALGANVNANNFGSVALGNELTASANYAFALGYRSRPNQYGQFTYASGYFAAGGDAQAGKFVLRRQTTNTTPALLTTDGSSAGSLYYVTLANNSAIAFTGMVVARQQSALGTSSAAWRIEGLIRRESGAATTTLVNTAITVISNVPGWVIALTADTTNGSLLITVTGTATNIRWVANVDTTEVAYA